MIWSLLQWGIFITPIFPFIFLSFLILFLQFFSCLTDSIYCISSEYSVTNWDSTSMTLSPEHCYYLTYKNCYYLTFKHCYYLTYKYCYYLTYSFLATKQAALINPFIQLGFKFKLYKKLHFSFSQLWYLFRFFLFCFLLAQRSVINSKKLRSKWKVSFNGFNWLLNHTNKEQVTLSFSHVLPLHLYSANFTDSIIHILSTFFCYFFPLICEHESIKSMSNQTNHDL